MNILDRWRLTRMKRDLAVLLVQDKQIEGETTDNMMDRMCARAEQIAMLRFNIRQIEGEVDIDPEDPDGTLPVPSSLFCPTTKPEE